MLTACIRYHRWHATSMNEHIVARCCIMPTSRNNNSSRRQPTDGTAACIFSAYYHDVVCVCKFARIQPASADTSRQYLESGALCTAIGGYVVFTMLKVSSCYPGRHYLSMRNGVRTFVCSCDRYMLSLGKEAAHHQQNFYQPIPTGSPPLTLFVYPFHRS
jgi:hypothetical protein